MSSWPSLAFDSAFSSEDAVQVQLRQRELAHRTVPAQGGGERPPGAFHCVTVSHVCDLPCSSVVSNRLASWMLRFLS